mmetsp:Transcript_4228/g.12712  ORF Transcript_4228/g.12712 Transcript_4228/m.12712 type:complete len:217 (-) Transcript_4228:235-885(-)
MMQGMIMAADTHTSQETSLLPSKGQSTYAKSNVDTGKMALRATNVANAPVCLTESKIDTFQRMLKTTYTATHKPANCPPWLSCPHEASVPPKTQVNASPMYETMPSPWVCPKASFSGTTSSVRGNWNSARCVFIMKMWRPLSRPSSVCPVDAVHWLYRRNTISLMMKDTALKMQLAARTTVKKGWTFPAPLLSKLGNTPKMTATSTPTKPTLWDNE